MGKVNSVRLNAPPKEYPLLILALSLFISIQLSALFFHEPWADEIQAWLLARDSQSLWELLAERVRYEPVPGLWHAVLWMGAQFSTNIVVLNICSSIIATLSCALILFASPLPLWIRLLLPFSYYFGYQYSIVARNYCVTSLGMLIAAIIYPQRLKRPLLYVLALVVVANSCAHGILLASAIALSDLPLKKDDWRQKASLLKQTPVFIAGVIAAILQMLPLPLDVKLPDSKVRFGWHTLLPSLDHSLTGLAFLSLTIFIASIWLFYRSKILSVYLMSVFLIETFFVSSYWMRWHSGILFLAWLFCVIQCYERKSPQVNSTWWKLTILTLLAVTIIQTAMSIQREIAYPSRSFKLASQDLKNSNIDINEVVYADYFGQMLRAYYPSVAAKPSYWIWSYKDDGAWTIDNTLFQTRAKVMIFKPSDDYIYPKNIFFGDRELVKKYERKNYHLVKHYQSIFWWRGQPLGVMELFWMRYN